MGGQKLQTCPAGGTQTGCGVPDVAGVNWGKCCWLPGGVTIIRLVKTQSLQKASENGSLHYIEGKTGLREGCDLPTLTLCFSARGRHGIYTCSLGSTACHPGDLTLSLSHVICKMKKIVTKIDSEASEQHLAIVVSTQMW